MSNSDVNTSMNSSLIISVRNECPDHLIACGFQQRSQGTLSQPASGMVDNSVFPQLQKTSVSLNCLFLYVSYHFMTMTRRKYVQQNNVNMNSHYIFVLAIKILCKTCKISL